MSQKIVLAKQAALGGWRHWSKCSQWQKNKTKALLSRRADYIKRAEEAEGMASRARGETARDTFQMIASGWRQLAERVTAILKGKRESE